MPGLLDLGRYPAGVDETALSVAAAFTKAGFVSEPRDDIMRWKYRKLVMNLGNAVTALCGTGSGSAAQVTELLRAEGEARAGRRRHRRRRRRDRPCPAR